MEDIKKAIEVLKYHQEWRKGAEMPQTDVKELTNALDTAIDVLSRWEESERWRKVEEELPEMGQLIAVKYKRENYYDDKYTIYEIDSSRMLEILKEYGDEWKPIH